MTIEKLNHKIRKANKKFCKAEKELDKNIRRKVSPLLLKEIKQKVAKEKRFTYSLISQKLEQTNEEYRALASTQNSRFSKNIDFKKYKESVGLIINAVNSFSGFLNPNGHIYCNGDFTLKTSFFKIIEPVFFQMVYPKIMKGKIDCLGNVSLKVEKYGWAFFKTMPEEFSSTIEEGKITITTRKRSSDFKQGDKGVVRKIISSFSFPSEAEHNSFLEAKSKLHSFIEKERFKL